MIATDNICSFCGKPVQTTALQGICPECMLKAGLIETGEVGPDGTVVVKAPSQPAPKVEEIAPLFPQLEILECLGRGGMGAVYKARQPKLDRFVALKILTRRQANGITETEFAARFQQEARALARLNHADIVAVYDFGEAGGFHYLLMEYVDGLTLRQLLQTRTISPEEALAIVPKICEALQFAHERGIVHRDIKPENILLDKQGRVKIADFGIAKILGATTAGASLTGAKDVIGTPHYMAPEQIEKPTKVDHRADIYSLGVVFYEMLTGELPLGKFQSPSKKVQVDVRLDEVVLHALEKEPERRYQHASEVKSDVETIAGKPRQPPEASPSQSMASQVEHSRRTGFQPIFASLVLLASFGAWVLFGYWTYIQPILVERLRSQASPIPSGQRLMFQLGSFVHAYYWFFVPLLVVTTAGSLVWLILASTRPRKLAWFGTGLLHASSWAVHKARTHVAPATVSKTVLGARWTARVLGTLLLVFYGFFVLVEGLPPIASQSEGVQLNFVALALMLLGFVIGWKREGTAALLIACGWTLWQISEGRVKWNLFQTPLPVAMLYGICWWATRGRRTSVVAGTVIALALALGLGQLFVPTSVFVNGAIVDAQTGQPVPNAELRLLPRPPRALEKGDLPNARANQNGRFTLYMGWFSAAKQVALSAPGYATLTTNLGTRALGERKLNRDFQLRPVAAASVEPQVPPVVVATVPESGATGIDPALTELRVIFSEPMRDGNWSWTKWGEDNFPELTGRPRFLGDQRTCVLPVRLRPGQVYAIWLNSESHQDFRDCEGQSAVPYLLIFETRK